MTPSAAPTCGPKVMLVNAPPSHAEDDPAGDREEPVRVRRTGGGEDPDHQTDDRADGEPDDERTEPRFEVQRE